jgi:iron complex transport system ATP-binding protein
MSVPSPVDPVPAVANPPALIELDDATVVRGQVRVLHGLSLRIEAGQHTAILGANGCGKSTFIKLITRELYPLARLAGAPVKVMGQSRWHVGELRSQLGIVTGDLHANLADMPELTVKEAVMSGFFASYVVPPHVEITASMRGQVLHALDQARALDLRDRPYAELSTGQARRVLIARALVRRPRALLLDEPTTGLDIVSRKQLLDAMRHLADEGVTLVLVTHHTEEIIPAIDRVVLMREGRILGDGPRAQMLTEARLSETYGAPVTLLHQGEDIVAIAR